MDNAKKPGSPGDILKHHGVKGMKWGVRNEEENGGTQSNEEVKALADHNAKTKAYIAAGKRIPDDSPKEALAKFATSQKKFAAKFEGSDAPAVKGAPGKIEGIPHKKGLTSGQKKALLYVGGSAAVIGGLYVGGNYLGKHPELIGKLFGMELPPKITASGLGIKSLEEIGTLAGKPIDAKNFHGLVGFSQGKTWVSGGPTSYLTDSAFAREAFELPAGHTFLRLSTVASETGFSPATYAVHSVEDFNRYAAGFLPEKSLMAKQFTKVSWKNKEVTKVPNLTTVLGALHSSMTENAKNVDSAFHGLKINDEMVMKEYQALSGGGWSTPSGVGMIAKLKEHGYSAIVDEMDAGVIGSTPLVFFGHETATAKTNVPFDHDAIEKAKLLLKEIPKPPGRKY